MRANIAIDDGWMAEAMKASGAQTKREAVEMGLRTLLRLFRKLRVLRGTRTSIGRWDNNRQDH